ncbi:PHP domain-containing protein [Tissierella pigra]|uniref:PHP domain-containing protein n=1 Tax=Tissierella pigra TaxID=2607614 RepID=A0A6N7XD53_9FIRM|nr:PHP domain-containing protein [Tissierella pigra]MBU5426596.1 PHP domain-containing protein [Tissierella pigra]MST99958.1 PHP domain-containing protein [Tissierella pigra]
MFFDLHIHTNHSDGLYSPNEVVDLAIEKNLKGIAITDHDTVTGIEIALEYGKKHNDFIIIPGIEFSCIFEDEEVHILGYFIDYKNKELIDLTNTLRKSRWNRGIDMIKKVNELGMTLTLEDVMEFSGKGYIGRPHIARAMIKKGYISNVSEGFDKFLDRGKPAYVDRYKISVGEIISLIKNIGGISILAHPGLLKNKEIIDYCISLDINGLECIHSKHSEEDTNLLMNIAKRNNLIITGGSDFHGDSKDGKELLGNYFINIDDNPKFKERI